jgi:hypothetical protein
LRNISHTMIFTDAEAINKIKELSKDGIPDWVTTARSNSKVYKALIDGEGFSDVLINAIEHIESAKKANARKKYSKDIRDVFERVMKPRINVFQANGGSEKLTLNNKTVAKAFEKAQNNFKSNKSVFKYLSEVYFNLADVDPNGLLFLEYKAVSKILYPTYKSIDDIYMYEANGQKTEFVVFEPEEKILGTTTVRTWRMVDDVCDRTLSEIGENILITSQFNHPFGEVPALILSEKEKIGTNIRLSAIEKITELAKDLARDKSILTIYKFQKGYPIHWRFVTQCRTCQGIGRKGEVSCTACEGHGYIKNTDVTDVVTIQIPDIDQPNIAPNIAGYVSPDFETWRQLKEDIKDFEMIMKDTIWGTHLYSSQNKNMQEAETATGRYIDVQPIINNLNGYADVVEYMDNTFCNWILNFIDPIKVKSEILYNKTYGRRYIIENPDVILLRYQEAKKTSDSSTILDKLLEEFILSKYKNDQAMQNIMLKKKSIEPYIHMTLEQVNTSFGAEEVYRKELFNRFWSQCNEHEDIAVLKGKFETYATANKKEFKKEVETSKI